MLTNPFLSSFILLYVIPAKAGIHYIFCALGSQLSQG
jgi:hypothetical protein